MVAALLVVARPPPDLAESGPLVEPPRRLVVLVHFEEHRVRAQTGQPTQMQVEQRAGLPPRAPARRERTAASTSRSSARQPRGVLGLRVGRAEIERLRLAGAFVGGGGEASDPD